MAAKVFKYFFYTNIFDLGCEYQQVLHKGNSYFDLHKTKSQNQQKIYKFLKS